MQLRELLCNKGKDKMSVFRITKKFNSILSLHQKIRVVQLVILMIIGGFMEMASVSLILPFMEGVMDPDAFMDKWYSQIFCSWLKLDSPRMLLFTAAVLMAVIFLFKNIYLLLEYNFQYRFVYGNMLETQKSLLNCYIRKPYEFFLKADSAEIIRILNQDTYQSFLLLSILLNIYTEIVVSGMIILTILIVAPAITICILLVLAALILAVIFVIKPKLVAAGIDTQNSSAGMNKWILQSIQGIKEIRVMSKEHFFTHHFERHGAVYVESLRKNYMLNVSPRFFIEAASMGSMFLVIAFLIYMGSPLEGMIPVLSVIAVGAVRLLPSISRIVSSLASIAYIEPMLDKLVENLKNIKDSGMADAGTEENLMQAQEEFQDKIQFDHVTYRYPDAEENILYDACMEIKKGKSVGIIGESGAGKSTAADILLGLLEPQQGAVLVDGADIRNYARNWNKQIGYIPQMLFMLDGTIRENIAFGIARKDVSDQDIWQALKEAALDKFVMSLPQGIDTKIGERGIRLSGGQRQRIGIARALYTKPAVLIFDEATSALDNETEAEIMQSVRALMGKKTVIIIAHRLVTIEACDLVYKVSDGTISKISG